MILAGDIGGTKTLLGLFHVQEGKPRSVREIAFVSREWRTLEAMVAEFLGGGRERVVACAMGVAGPVVGGRSHVVNLPWAVDAGRLARSLRLRRVTLLNDVEAAAWGLPHVAPRHVVSLTPRLRPAPGNALLVAAGTGLGTAILHWDGERHVPSASEGGHIGFAPRGEDEIGLLRFLARRHGRVSVERIVSGDGLGAIYRYLLESTGHRPSARTKRSLARGDVNAAIAAAGARGRDRLAARSLDLFVSLLGSVTGDLALVARATGGVYLAGGIAPKIVAKLRSGGFVRAFRDKGRLSPLVRTMPVRVILEPRAALLGAAARALLPPSTPRSSPRRRRRSP